MKKILFISLLFICCGKSFGQILNFNPMDSTMLFTDRDGSGVQRFNKLRPVSVQSLSRTDSSGKLKMLVVDTTRAAAGLRSVYWIDIPAGGSGGGGGGGTVYVDSVSNNAGGDSLIVYKNGVRRAYAYPSGTSTWTHITGGQYNTTTSELVSIGQNTVDAKLHVVTADDATPASFLAWDNKAFVVAASGSQGGGMKISRTASTATTNFIAIQPGIAWENFLFRANTHWFQNSGGTTAVYMSSNAQIGFNTSSNLYSDAQFGKSVGFPMNPRAGNYTITGSDYMIEYTVVGGGHTYTLPTAVGITGRQYVVSNSGTGVLTLVTTSSQTFDNVTGVPTSLIIPAKSSITINSNGTGWLVSSSYVKTSQGADVASANNLVLNSGGYTFEITGTTQVNLIASTGWQNGSEVTLLLASGITIKHGQTTSGSNITISLSGATDLVTAAETTLTLVLSEMGGTQKWRQKGAAISY